jgi:hypothetical protein
MSELQNKDKTKKRSENLFPVVGVGASAGGLEAFKRLIKAIPEISGVAYILIYCKRLPVSRCRRSPITFWSNRIMCM